MRDFPIFTTEYGVSSLILREIPYKKEAYIRIRDVQRDFFDQHLQECVSFCRMAGAEKVLAADHELLERFPLYTSVWEMRGTAWSDCTRIKNLFPVTEATVAQWRQLHNTYLRGVDCSATLTARDERELVAANGVYFIHDAGELLGIGWLEDTLLKAVAAIKPGAGEQVMHTLMSLTEGEQMRLEVASTNSRAIRLYERLGFARVAEPVRWYRVDSDR